MPSLDDIRILVVDDRSHVRKIVRYMLGRIGMKNIIEAQDGREAYNLLVDINVKKRDGNSRDKIIQLVIADWMMPNMTGIEFLEATRRTSELSQIPFILLTAEAEREQIMEAMSLGVSDYISKPFTAEVLEEKVCRVLAPQLKAIQDARRER